MDCWVHGISVRLLDDEWVMKQRFRRLFIEWEMVRFFVGGHCSILVAQECYISVEPHLACVLVLLHADVE